MSARPTFRERGIALLVSDVDGTLLSDDKHLSDANVAAVKRLRDHGVGFTLVSSRPPVGMRHLIEVFDLTLPLGAFNGGTILQPDLKVVEETALPEAAAREAAAFLAEQGIAVWVFADNAWIITDPKGDKVDFEEMTIRTPPRIVPEFGDTLARAGKIVGACDDHAKLARCTDELRRRIGAAAIVARSQAYYVDVTPPKVDKGTFVHALARILGLPIERIAAIGDMHNDVPMLDVAGLSIAMGNAGDDVRAHADLVTRSNGEDGVAHAIDTFILSGRGVG